MKRPLAYITAAWSGSTIEDAETAARYCSMKKQITMLLCTIVLLLGIAVPPALAAGGPYYPISVEEYTAGSLDEPRISKVYQLSLADDPSGIPTEDFVRDGRRYYLLDLIKEDEVGVDTQDYTDTVTQDSDTNDLSQVLKQLEPHREVMTEDGYTGLLVLDYTSVNVEAKGYKTSTRSLSASRTYPNLSDADVSLVPKTITDSGKTLNLGAVEWSGGEDGHYTATATYTGTASSKYATGYTVTASYTGQVSKTGCEVVTYTAVFGSEEVAESGKKASQHPRPVQPDTSSQGVDWAAVLGCAGGVTVLAAAAAWSIQKFNERRKRP